MIATAKTTSSLPLKGGKPVEPGEDLYIGNIPGIYQYDMPGGGTAVSNIQPYFKRTTTPFVHVTYSESQLLLAEAAYRGWVSGSAAEYYKKGVEAGIKQLEVYDAPAASQLSIDTYLAANPLMVGSEMKQISTQLWVTYIFNSIEAYSNWRRTGFRNWFQLQLLDLKQWELLRNVFIILMMN